MMAGKQATNPASLNQSLFCCIWFLLVQFISWIRIKSNQNKWLMMAGWFLNTVIIKWLTGCHFILCRQIKFNLINQLLQFDLVSFVWINGKRMKLSSQKPTKLICELNPSNPLFNLIINCRCCIKLIKPELKKFNSVY